MLKQISDNKMYLLIKYIKSVLWRVVKCLSYIEETRCLKVNSNYVVCFLLGNSPASEVYTPTFRNTLSVPSSQAGTYEPEESIQHPEHGKSLKSRIILTLLFFSYDVS